ncbi:MAG TPA: response regulator transcription factor [Dehalococcoidia bacterium]|nr:response regulator transcription factor [Dehalococcoidia bacterium]
MKPIDVLLVDDEARVRRGLRMLFDLEPDVRVVGEAADGVTAVQLARQLQPDVVVMDIEMAGGDGLTATFSLARERTAVVVLTIHDSERVRRMAARAGAAAFVSKHEGGARLLEVIRSVAAPREDTP